jgi:hypothetical protein
VIEMGAATFEHQLAMVEALINYLADMAERP